MEQGSRDTNEWGEPSNLGGHQPRFYSFSWDTMEENQTNLDAIISRRLSGSSQGSDSVRSTRSLHSADLEAVTENSRTYPNESFYLPCDIPEQTRLSILHQVYLSALDGALITSPINAGIQRILDVGTGPGDWAVAMAAKYPSAEVVAVDIAVWDVEATEDAVVQEGNELRGEVTWVIDDLDLWGPDRSGNTNLEHSSRPTFDENYDSAGSDGMPDAGEPVEIGKGKEKAEEGAEGPLIAARTGWDFSEPFDFIHIRGMKGAFSNWEGVYTEAYKNLCPGGWIEVVDFDHQFKQPGICDTLLKTVYDTAEKIGYPINVDHLQPEMLEAAGFTEVMEFQAQIPLGTWPADERQRAVGKKWLVCAIESVEAICMRLLTKQLGWDAEQVREECKLAKEELLGGLHDSLRTPFIFVTARKPKH